MKYCEQALKVISIYVVITSLIGSISINAINFGAFIGNDAIRNIPKSAGCALGALGCEYVAGKCSDYLSGPMRRHKFNIERPYDKPLAGLLACSSVGCRCAAIGALGYSLSKLMPGAVMQPSNSPWMAIAKGLGLGLTALLSINAVRSRIMQKRAKDPAKSGPLMSRAKTLFLATQGLLASKIALKNVKQLFNSKQQ